MNAINSSKIELLYKDNYDTWKLQKKAMLIRSDVWSYDSWVSENDQKTMSDIIWLIRSSKLKQVKNCETSRSMWLKLQEIYESIGPARKAILKFLKENTDCMRPIRRRKLISDGFKEPLYGGLCALSDEILLEILKKLDLKMLCRMSQVNKQFNILTRDSLLYTRLNMKYIDRSESYIQNIFCYFTFRCKYLQQLDLTCSKFRSSDFIKFLEYCGKDLTHLRLTHCRSIDNLAAVKISQICKNLKELDLRNSKHQTYNLDENCPYFDNRNIYFDDIEPERLELWREILLDRISGFVLHPQNPLLQNNISDINISCFENLENLEHLRFSYRNIESSSLYKIFRKNPRMRELNMTFLGDIHFSCGNVNLDSTLIELKNLCPCLEIISLSLTCNTSREAMNALADCKNLRKVHLRNCERSNSRKDINFIRCFSSCQRLEELLLYYTSFTERDLNFLMQCENLKQLYLYYCNTIEDSSDKYVTIIKRNCPKLRKLHISNRYGLMFCKMEWNN